MNVRRRNLLCGALGLAVATAFAAPAARADDFAEGAGKFISSLADQAVAALTKKDVPRPERVRRFRVLLNENFAVETIARWVLGRHWQSATDEQRKEYVKLFEDLLVKKYVDRFIDYSGEKLSVNKSVVTDNNDAVVYTSISRPSQGQPLDVEWRVRAREGKFRIVDVMVAGVSMGVTQRQEFASVFSHNGGNMQAFLKELRARVDGA